MGAITVRKSNAPPKIDSGRLKRPNGKFKKMSLIAFAVVVPLIAADFVVLKGEPVYSVQNLRFSELDLHVLKIPIKLGGTKHTVRLDTGEQTFALGWILTDDHGTEITSNAELVRHDGRRRFTFTPDLAGSYTLKIRREQRSSGQTESFNDAVSVVITANDRQILAPLYDWLGL